MSGQKDLSGELDESTSGIVKFGDGSSVKIKGKGSVILQGKDGNQKIISNVYYIPELCNNILSLGQLTEIGCKIEIKDEFLRLYDKDDCLLINVKRSGNRLYKTPLSVVSPTCLLNKMEDKAWVWHARLGHINFKALDEMTRQDMVVGVPRISHPDQVCDACMAGKQKRLPFPQQTSFRADKPLELIHADI